MYKIITRAAMEDKLRAEKGWRVLNEENKAQEIIYSFPIKKYPHISVVVCSSIHKKSGVSRGCGKDAIRIFAINEKHEGKNGNHGWISSRRVYRTDNWRIHLENAVMKVFNAAKARAEKAVVCG